MVLPVIGSDSYQPTDTLFVNLHLSTTYINSASAMLFSNLLIQTTSLHGLTNNIFHLTFTSLFLLFITIYYSCTTLALLLVVASGWPPSLFCSADLTIQKIGHLATTTTRSLHSIGVVVIIISSTANNYATRNCTRLNIIVKKYTNLFHDNKTGIQFDINTTPTMFL